MYPLNVFSLFPPFPRENKVFVAMSFESQFDRRWADVIIQAVRNVEVNGTPLEPYRVDVRTVSDSILTEIITGISNCTLFFADITTIGRVDKRPIRNGNVMYEIGLAHAVRLPEEVILFRSDNDPLLFDVTNIRVNHYEPDDAPEGAREKVSQTLMTCLKEIDFQKHLSVQRAVSSLDFSSFDILMRSTRKGGLVSHPVVRSIADGAGKTHVISAICRLLELGILSTQYLHLTPEILTERKDWPSEKLIQYKVTPFGKAVFEKAIATFAFSSPEVQQAIESLAPDENASNDDEDVPSSSA